MLKDDRAGPGGDVIDFKIGDFRVPMNDLLWELRKERDRINDMPRNYDRELQLADLRSAIARIQSAIVAELENYSRLLQQVCTEEIVSHPKWSWNQGKAAIGLVKEDNS